MAFSHAFYEKEFSSRTEELRVAYRNGELFKTICYLRYLSSFYYRINYKFADDELEGIMYITAHKLLGKTVLECCDENTVLFYDNFGLMTRGLANIYVKALIKLGFHVIWVLYDFLPDVFELQNYYQSFDNIELYVIPKQTILERMHRLQQIIQEGRPRHIFVYTTPDDVAGLGVMATVTGNSDRYLIDLTDHAFWLGKCAVDWIIGFRNYGYNIAIQCRGVAPEKVVILPYYPDSRENYPFEGMPFDVEKSEFIFSGGSPYKIEGDSAYQEIVQYILEGYPNVKFVYAGNGTNQTLDELECKFPTQFFHINERKDLDAILRRAKFFLSTYPIAGGLMIQFALQNRCVPLSLCHSKGSPTDLKNMLLVPQKANFIFYEKERLLAEIDRLMQDRAYISSIRKELTGQVISEERFTENLKQLILNKKTEFVGARENIDIEPFLAIYRKNATYELFCELVYASRNKWVYKKHPIIVWQKRRKHKKQVRMAARADQHGNFAKQSKTTV